MRILILESHPMWINGLPNGFVDAGHEVMISGFITAENIQDMITSFKPDLIFSMGHTPEHTAYKQQLIREYVKPTDIPFIYWATEDPGYTFNFTLPLIRTTQPDFVFTICQSRVNFYKERGIPAAHLDFGYHSHVNFPTRTQKKYKAKLAVVANGYPMLYDKRPDHYRFKSLTTLLSPFIKNGDRIDFWGKYWDNMDHIIGKEIPLEWIHGPISYNETNKVYSTADIILGIQNHRTQITQRTYEVLGSGGFLITSDTPEIRKLFTPGEHLVVTSSPEETIHLVDYYLRNPKQRKKIQEAGMKKVQDYSYEKRAKFVLETLVREGFISEQASVGQNGKLLFYRDVLKEKYEVYTVQNGDTLWGISHKFDVQSESIKELNGLYSDEIEVNQLLKIRNYE